MYVYVLVVYREIHYYTSDLIFQYTYEPFGKSDTKKREKKK